MNLSRCTFFFPNVHGNSKVPTLLPFMVLFTVTILILQTAWADWPTSSHQFIPFYSGLQGSIEPHVVKFRSDSSVMFGCGLNSMTQTPALIQIVNHDGSLPLGINGRNILPTVLYQNWTETDDGFICVGTNGDALNGIFQNHYQRVRGDGSLVFGVNGLRIHPELDSSALVLYSIVPGIEKDSYLYWWFLPRDSIPINPPELSFIERRDSLGQIVWSTPPRSSYNNILCSDGEGGVLAMVLDTVSPSLNYFGSVYIHYRANGSIAWQTPRSPAEIREDNISLIRSGNYVVISHQQDSIAHPFWSRLVDLRFLRYSDGGFVRLDTLRGDSTNPPSAPPLYPVEDGFFWGDDRRYNTQCQIMWIDTLPQNVADIIVMSDGRRWIKYLIDSVYSEDSMYEVRQNMPNGMFHDSSFTMGPDLLFPGFSGGLFQIKLLFSDEAQVINCVDSDFRFHAPDTPVLAVPAETHEVPAMFSIDKLYPNPANGEIRLRYELLSLAPIRMRIYDDLGREVLNEFFGIQRPGLHTISWSGVDRNLRSVASGVYFIGLKAGEKEIVRKFVFVK